MPALPADVCYSRFDAHTSTWTLGNAHIEASFRLMPEGSFRYVALINKASGRTWSAPDAQPSSPVGLTVNAVTLGVAAQYELAGHESTPIEREGIRQSIVLNARALPAQIRFEAEVHAGQPFLRYRTFYKNTAGATSRVTEADMLPWTFRGEGRRFRGLFVGQWSWGGDRANFEPHEVDLSVLEGPVEAFTGAYGNHATWGAVRDDEDHGIIFGWEFDGRARAHAEWNAQYEVLRTDSQVQRLYHAVAPSDEFAVPGAFLGLYRGDWDEAGYRTQRYVDAVLAARLPGSEAERFPYVAFDSWGYQWDINEEMLREAARRAAAIGVELFTIDFGWAKVTGDWHPDPQKFPNGLKPFSEFVHSLGMKFGLHLPFAEAAADSQILRRNPDWAVTPAPSAQRGYFGAQGLCLSHRPVQEWVISEILRVVRENGVDWLLQDGENMVKGCFAANHTHHAEDSNYSNSVEGLNAVVEAVQRAEPGLMWENCEDGGNMQTFRMVQSYVTSIVNDNSDFLTTRRSIYGATFPFPPRYTDRYMETTPWDNYRTRSHFFGGPLIIMSKITEWPDFMVEFTKKELAIYKAIRRHVSEGKVYHLSPPPDGAFNDFIQSHHPATDRSVIFVYRQETESSQTAVHPRGLRAEGVYRVRFQDAPRSYTATGREIMDSGIVVELPSEYFAEIVYIEPASS
ncbi:MAG: alpha-galactosidase [Bryobacteraceae bacterium]